MHEEEPRVAELHDPEADQRWLFVSTGEVAMVTRVLDGNGNGREIEIMDESGTYALISIHFFRDNFVRI